MYKSAARVNTTLLKRINKQSPCANKLVPPKRESHCSKSNNAACRAFSLKEVAFPSGRGARKVHPSLERAPSSLVHWQKKWLIQPSIFTKDCINNARMFSGKTKGNENFEKDAPSSSSRNQKRNAKESGCASKKVSNKRLPEGHGSKWNVETSEGINAQKKEHLNVRSLVKEKRKRDPSEVTTNKCRTHNLQRSKLSIESIAGKNIPDFERLQLVEKKILTSLKKKWISWENLTNTFENFPCDVHRNIREVLLDCVAARVKKHELSNFGESLSCTSNLILLQGQPGTEMYQEALVNAVAHELRVSLLVADSSTLSTKDWKEDDNIAGLNGAGNKEKIDEKALQEGKKSTCMSSLTNSRRMKQMIGHQVKILDLKNLKKNPDIPQRVLSFATSEGRNEEFEKCKADKKHLVLERCEEQSKKLGKRGEEFQKLWHNLNIGDDVRYKGQKANKEKFRETVKIGQEGIVSSISHSLPWKVCVKFHGVAEEIFCNAAELEKVDSNVSDEGFLARFPELPIKALFKMVNTRAPVIVFFPDIQQWFSRLHSSGHSWLFPKLKDLISKVDGPVVFIASSYEKDTGAPLAGHPFMEAVLQQLIVPTVSYKDPSPSQKDSLLNEISNIFKNAIKLMPPKEPNLLSAWQKGLQENKRKVMSARNITLLQESLNKNGMMCAEVLDMSNVDVQLTSESADDVVGWARNMIYHSNQLHTSNRRLVVGKKWLERSLLRLKDLTSASEDKTSHVAGLMENEYEKCLVPSVIQAHEIGVNFGEIGALENVKDVLNEIIVLPLKRPELFKKGNLRKPCKGVLLFGPPGTGKTLIAKAVATEAGASFINISAASITSKYYGEDEKLVQAIFSLAKKLSPAVIFVDEVDSILGSRNDSTEHEAMRRIKNEFMAAWDGLLSRENEQILVFAATNRPFDLDDAVIRRLPRRIFVDLPNTENRVDILRIILANEDLDNTFSFESLSLQTEGYSGSDLKNLCGEAAYVPIREFLEAEQKANEASRTGCSCPESVRPLCMHDFWSAKAKIGASLAYDASAMVQLRQWNDQYGEGGSRWHKKIGFSQ